MAASARICCGGGGIVFRDQRTVIARSPPSVVPMSRRCTGNGKIRTPTAKMAAVKLGGKRIGGGGGGGGRDTGAVVSREKLDEWMRDSVVEIVKNLRESPLLLHVYAGSNGSLTSTAAKTAAAEDWPAVKGKWERGEERTPEGVIFVEKLGGEGDIRDRDDGGAWGIVAQGRGTDCGPVCYLLKTNRVGSGLGQVCTHFCFVKVKSFRETAMSQLSNCWLVQ